jgi:hypothetical protein
VLPTLLGWLIVAIAATATGAVERSPVPPPAIAAILTISVLLLAWLIQPVRSAAHFIPTGALVGLHLIRIVAGANFLRLAAAGDLPTEFADVAGWGDIAVGVGAALVLAFCLPPRTAGRRRALLAWNALGLADILLVLGNGTRLFLQDGALAGPFTTLPLSLLPLFVVPLVIASHVLLFARYGHAADTESSQAVLSHGRRR